MAKADLEVPFMGFHGKLDRDSEIYYTTRFGETVVSHYPKHKDPKKISDNQRQCNSIFQQAVAEADRQLSDPDTRAHWQTLFNEQRNTSKKTYRYLRNFVIATINKQLTETA